MRSPGHTSRTPLQIVSVIATTVLVTSLLSMTDVTAAVADTAPVPPTPSTVSTDPLPTPQINGVVWDQVIVGNTVYVAGDFSRARPFGSAPGANEVNRSYALAYNLTTGALLPWAPTFNAQVRALAASPDGTRLYVVGDFTQVNGIGKNRIVAFDTQTGNVVTSFNASANYRVYAVAATNTTVFYSGPFTSAGGNTRLGGAAALASNGSITAWAPELAGGRAYGIVLSPDASKVVIGGDFTTVNGSNNPGYGLAMVDATQGQLITPFAANAKVRNAGTEAAIFALESDADSFYGSGYVFGSGGNLEGIFRANWSDNEIVWINDCHGDTYSVSASPTGAIYAAGHAHYCGNIDGYPQTDPWTFYRGIAFTKEATGVISNDPYGYPNWVGNKSPSLLNFFPNLNLGQFTGQFQGPWDASSNDQYAVYGGEFTQVNGRAQQGLVRFAVPAIAPNLDGPRLTGDNFVPTMSSPAAGVISLSWPANYDRDNETLTYQVVRDGRTGSPVYETTQSSRFYNQPTMTYLDTGLTPGQTYTYRLRAIDPFGNNGWGSTVSFTAGGSGTLSTYARSVMNDQPTNYWRLGESGGSTAVDSVGRANALARAGVGFGQAGAVVGDSNTAADFTGATNSYTASSERVWRDQTMSVEAWFKTSTTAGGKIVGFGSSQSGNSGNYDRHIYMDTAGRVNFGVYPGNTQIIRSAQAYNDNSWHHVVGSLGATGMELWVDGVSAGVNPATIFGQNYWGYWRIGGDNTWSGARYFDGQIDEVAVYPKPLSGAQVQTHYTLSGRNAGAQLPVAAFTQSTAGLVASFDASSSSDGDGTITGYAWDFGDGTSGTGVTPSHTYADPGDFTVTLTVTDNQGWMGMTTAQVTVAAAVNLPPTASFSHSETDLTASFDGSASTDPDGTIAGYAWDFGDGTSGTGATTSHLYAAGTYTVVLTVTDDKGTTATVSHPVTVAAAANVLPTAAFTHTVTDNAANFDASTSADPDGTISTYEWGFGDASTGIGQTPAHSYEAAGTYTAVLTVTDNRGGIATVSHPVTVGAPPAVTVLARDEFSRTVGAGWGSADAGGAWTTNSAGNSSVGSGVGVLTHNAGSARQGWLSAVSTNDVTVIGSMSVNKTITGGGAYTGLIARQVGSDYYQARVRYFSGGAVAFQLLQGGSTILEATTIAGMTYAPGEVMQAKVQAYGTSPTTIRGKVWKAGTAEPAGWTLTTTSSSAGLQFAGSVGTVTYLSGSATNSPVAISYDNFLAVAGHDDGAGPANLAPTAQFTNAAAGLTASFDSTTSSDPDGTVVSRSWTFGDGATSTEASPSHSYAVAGTYTVTLTVTDNQGATGSASRPITVTASPVNVAPVAAFTTVADQLAATFDAGSTTDPDGTIAGYAWNFGDGASGTGATPSHAYAAAGTYTVTLTATDDDGATNAVSHVMAPTAASVVPEPTKTVVVIMENKSNTQIIGSAEAPFINSLATGGALMTQSFGVIHPSQPNYFALFGGSLNGVIDNSCPHTFTTTNLYDQLSADGKSFIGYSESLPSVGFTGCESGDYARKHNPWVNWSSVPAAANQPFTAFPTDFSSLPTVSFVIPNLQHDMHDGTIAEADSWLEDSLGAYVTWAKANNSLLVLTWDEDDGGASNQIPTVFVGEQVQPGQYSQTIDHYDVLRTMQDAYRLPSNDLSAAASPISTIWTGAVVNQPPTAAFTSAVTDLGASFDAAGSTDPEGAISTYAWNFGDGTTGNGVTTSHDYATAGTYTVTLTVTDAAGATGAVSHPVTATSPGGPPAAIATDDFERTVAAGWGTANTGGAWSSNVNSTYTVSAGTGAFVHTSPGAVRRALLGGVSVTDVEAQVEISIDKAAESGHIVAGVVGRQVGSAFYQGRARIQPGGVVGLQLLTGSSSVLANMTMPGMTYTPGDVLVLKVKVTGTNPTTIQAKLWRAGTTEPAAWQLSATDATAALQTAGSIGFESYISSSSPNAPIIIRYDNFVARTPQ